MDSEEVMRLLATAYPAWADDLDRVLRQRLFYVDIAEWSRLLIDDLREGALERAGLRKVFAVLERAFEQGDPEACNVLAVGMFESMQSNLYRNLEVAEAFESGFGPKSYAAWCALIEGWTGEGIRTMAQWAAVVRNGATAGYRRSGPDGMREVRREGDGGRLTTRSSSTWIEDTLDLDADQYAAEVAWLRPLRASRWVRWLTDGDEARHGLDMPMATLTLFGDGPDGEDYEVRYGASAPDGGRWATDGGGLFVMEAWWE